jgi:hypothetical protein
MGNEGLRSIPERKLRRKSAFKRLMCSIGSTCLVEVGPTVAAYLMDYTSIIDLFG